MAIKETKQLRFNGGLTENIRDTSGNKVWYTENVLIENGAVAQTANNNIQNTASYNSAYGIVRIIEGGGYIWGLGQDNATNKDVTLYRKSAGTSNAWAAVTNGTISSTTLRLYDPFLVYNNGDIYLDGGNNYICKYSGTTMTNNWQALTSGLYGGVMWQGDMYGYQGQKIYKITTAPSATDMITIPIDQTIKQMIPFGNYMAIICSGGAGLMSKMYLWDGVNTTTFTEIVEIGVGSVSGGSVLDGVVYAVLGLPNNKGFRIMAYTGGRFQTVQNYTGRFNRARTYNYTFPASTVKNISGHIYFMVVGTRSDSTFAAIYEAMVFKYGRQDVNDNYKMSCWKTLNSSAVEGSNAYTLGNDFVVYESSVGQAQPQMLSAVVYGLGGANTSYYFEMTNGYNATEDVSSASGVIETVIYNSGEPHQEKQLKGIALFYDPLPTAGSVTLKYRKDEETTWTTIFTDGTDSAVSHATTVIESSGANLPTYKEIQFRIEFSGNAKITGLKFKYAELNEQNY
jgi:hypothetical protein